MNQNITLGDTTLFTDIACPVCGATNDHKILEVQVGSFKDENCLPVIIYFECLNFHVRRLAIYWHKGYVHIAWLEDGEKEPK